MNPRKKDENGWNCLHHACSYCENLEVIKYFIEELKMDPGEKVENDEKDEKEGFNCLHLASRSNHNVEVVKYLVRERGMDPKEKT